MKLFTQSITQQAELVYDLRATLNNEARYFIVKVPSAKRAAFLKAVEKDEGFRLEDYGTVLHRGWDEPGDELKTKLNKAYGMYPDFVEHS